MFSTKKIMLHCISQETFKYRKIRSTWIIYEASRYAGITLKFFNNFHRALKQRRVTPNPNYNELKSSKFLFLHDILETMF